MTLIRTTTINSGADPDTREAFINLENTSTSQNPNVKFINTTGNAYFAAITRILVHELLHAIDQIPDPKPTTANTEFIDTYEPSVARTNEIMEELNASNPDRAGYAAVLREGHEYFEHETSFTFGEKVSQVVVLDELEKVGDGTVVASKDGDLIIGSTSNDKILGNVGKDYIYGGSGNDFLTGFVNDDYLNGGKGDDQLLGGGNDDTLDGDEDNDSLVGGTGKDKLFGGANSDELSGGTKDNVLTGIINAGSTDLETLLFDDEEQDVLVGGAGSDVYFIHRAEHTLDVDETTPLSYYDFIEGWNIHYEVQSGINFDSTLERFETVDRIRTRMATAKSTFSSALRVPFT